MVNMVDQKKIDRINELARKNKYLANFRKNFRARLENIEVVSPEEYERRMKGKKNN